MADPTQSPVTASVARNVELRARFTRLANAGASGFDPVGMRIAESLLQRLDGLEGAALTDVQSRILQRLQQIQAAFEQARNQAKSIGRPLLAQYPQRNDEVVRLFRAGDFRAIDRLARHCHSQIGPSPLTELLQMLASHDPALNAGADPDTFDEILRKQELEAQQGNGLSSLNSHLKTRLDTDELRSTRRFRDLWAQRAIDRAIARALEEAPENAGPLNAHLLVIRALNTMGDISPDYLNRFVSYVDTLVWLEQAGARLAAPESKDTDTKPKPRRNGA